MSFVILGIIVAVVFITINKYVSSEDNYHEFEIVEIDWITSLSELVENKLIHDEKGDVDLKVYTTLDIHGEIMTVDLFTLHNRFYKSISPLHEFDSKRYTKVQ